MDYGTKSLWQGIFRKNLVSALFLAAIVAGTGYQANADTQAWEQHMSEGNLALEQKQTGPAEKLFKAALGEAGRKELKAEALHALANLYDSQGQLNQAEEVCKQALSINANDDDAVDELIKVYDKQGSVAQCADARKEKERITAKLKQLDFGTYMTTVQSGIKSQWRPPRVGKSSRIRVNFVLMRDGTILAAWLTKSSGDRGLDKASVDAVAKAGPFAALPPGAPENVTIAFTFDYNANKSWQEAKEKNVGNAEEMLRSAEKRLAADDPMLAWQMVETANVYRDYQRYDGAVSLYNKALAMQTKSFGDNQPIVGRTLDDLGMCYSSTGKLSEAEPLFQKALKIAESQESTTHDPKLLREVLENYGALLYKMNRKEEGDKYFARLKALLSTPGGMP